MADLAVVWDRVAQQVEQHRQQTAADWQAVEYRLRVVALLAVRCAVACHQLAGTEVFDPSNYFRSPEPPLNATLSERVRRQAAEKQPIVFAADSLQRATDGWSDALIVGTGGFGIVYRAKLPSDGANVAVKSLQTSADDRARMK